MGTCTDRRRAPRGLETTVREGATGWVRSVASYYDAYAPAPAWEAIPAWPPDAFAVANLVLDHTEAYRFVVAPPAGRPWPPAPDWNQRVTRAAREWAACCGQHEDAVPEMVQRCWATVSRLRQTPLSEVRTGEAWELCEALLTLHAMADEACSGLSTAWRRLSEASFERLAWAMLEEQGTLSHFAPGRLRVVPKTHFARRGISIRSLSRYVALSYESVDLRWTRVDTGAPPAATAAPDRTYSLLLIPWPLSVSAADFRPVSTPLGNMDPAVFGFFQFTPRAALDVDYVESLMEAARSEVGRVDAVILPEAALNASEVNGVQAALARQGVGVLVAGVREAPSAGVFGRNYLHFGVRTARGWEQHQQDKHHRWCLDADQIRQYHLAHTLDPRKLWWEAVDIRARRLHVIDVGGGATCAPLVCEDLARLDEVADVLRRIGPTLVIAVLLDGPQLASRWPCRYAAVLADEPGSAVLTLSSYGMVARALPAGKPRSRVVALWNTLADGLHEIELERGADAISLRVGVRAKTVWTADGRCHKHVPDVVLAGIQQLHARGPRPVQHAAPVP